MYTNVAFCNSLLRLRCLFRRLKKRLNSGSYSGCSYGSVCFSAEAHTRHVFQVFLTLFISTSLGSIARLKVRMATDSVYSLFDLKSLHTQGEKSDLRRWTLNYDVRGGILSGIFLLEVENSRF